MDTNTWFIAAFFIACVVIAYLVARRNGGASPLDLATTLVIDAENLIKPRPGETWEQANQRKLQYVLDKLKATYPDVDTVLLGNIIEGAVDVVKRRLVK